jgi:hypothetical protein
MTTRMFSGEVTQMMMLNQTVEFSNTDETAEKNPI